ncbi:MAG: YjbQ family protein [Candidatus Zixiibacteriota bacterium]|nr:MAG: YjbQ family protein [candidate division Zixibacteria bacterium]HDL02591.1 YjbQ family protein [candidate division Zixibacteria bacterium]
MWRRFLKAEQIQVKTHQREELIDITREVQNFVAKSGVDEGILYLFVPHTTGAVTINENADPDVKRDILYKLNKEIPQNDGYHHGEGNSDAHVKSSLVGPSLQIIITGGQPLLGTWQGVYFCEFDGPRSRKLYLKAVAG